jgi:parallel beta-helix repeat protein
MIVLSLPDTAQAQASLDVDLSGQQQSPSVPSVPDTLNAIFVDARNGNDSQGNGSRTAPYKTITFASSRAPAGSLIQLFPGIYSEESGEQFPLELQSGQILRGDESTLGEGFLIAGGGTYVSPTVSRQSVAILARGEAEIRGVTVRNEGRRGYAIWVESANPKIYNNSFVGNIHDGVFVAGQSAPWIEGNRFYQNGANGISILGTSTPTIVNNLFQETGFGITVDQRSSPTIRDNRILQNRAGVIVGGNSTPKLRGNLISRNLQSGLVAITLGAPDLGTASDPGNNIFEGNGEFDVNNSTRGIQVAAFGNNFGGALNGEVSTAGQASVPNAAIQAPGAVAEGSLTLPNTTPAVAEPPAETPVAAQPVAQPPAAQGLPTVSVPASESPVEQVPIAQSPTPLEQSTTPVAQQPASQPDNFQVVPFTPSESEVTPVGGNSSSPASPNQVSSGATLTDITTLLPRPGQQPAPPPPVDPSPVAPPPPLVAAPPSPATEPVASTDGTQFRVLVTSPASGDLDRVRQIAPEARETVFNGSNVLEAGLYSSRSAAQAVLDQLLDAGLAAIAEIVFR